MSGEQLPEVWGDFNLDARVLEAIRTLGWSKPTTVQRACVSHCLKGHDVCVQSRTGSGKTGAFAVPLAHRLITEAKAKQAGKSTAELGPMAMVLVPSVELCAQTETVLNNLCKYLKPRATIENLCTRIGGTHLTVQSGVDVIVSTPAAIAKHLRAKTVDAAVLKALRMLIIDEADLLMSLNSLRSVQTMLPPSGLQRILLSATLTEGVASMKGQLLRNPTNITLTEDQSADTKGMGGKAMAKAVKSLSEVDRGADYEEGEEETQEEPGEGAIIESNVTVKNQENATLKQRYLVATDACHHQTLLYALYRLQLIEGRTLIFVESEEATYKLQHFMEQMAISTIVYDTTLPLNIRLDMLRRFQKGEVNTLICTDGTLEKAERCQLDVSEDDKESGLQRGIDFNQIKNVIMYDGIDYPTAINFSNYTHRAGRTGRAGNSGLSIVMMTVHQAQTVSPHLKEYVKSRGEKLRPFKEMKRDEATRLQYRVDSALSNVTRASTRKLRVATVAAELARSKHLSTQMNENDTEALRKIVGKAKKSVTTDQELLNVPSYMDLKKGEETGDQYKDRVKGKQESKATTFARVAKRKRDDPLKQLAAKARRIE